MLLVKKENQMISYGKIMDKDVIPLIDIDRNKTYIVEISHKDNKIKKIKVLQKIKKYSEMDDILNNLYLICKEQNLYNIYELE